MEVLALGVRRVTPAPAAKVTLPAPCRSTSSQRVPSPVATRPAGMVMVRGGRVDPVKLAEVGRRHRHVDVALLLGSAPATDRRRHILATVEPGVEARTQPLL